MRAPLFAVRCAAPFLLLAACADDTERPTPAEAAPPMLAAARGSSVSYKIATFPGETTLVVGQRHRLEIRAYVTSSVALGTGGLPAAGTKVAWSSGREDVARVSANGEVTARAAGTALVIAKWGGARDTAYITVEAPEPPTPGPTIRIPLQVIRRNNGSGRVLVSNGIPLPEGALRASDVRRVRLEMDGEEQQIRVEALRGKHRDGSLRAILVQFYARVPRGSSTPAMLSLRATRTTSDLDDPRGPRGNPAAVALPKDPRYLLSTGLFGPTVTRGEAEGLGASFRAYEAAFEKYADMHWERAGADWHENYYDRAHVYYAFWARTGNVEYWDRATQIALDYRKNYLTKNGYSSSPHWAQLGGIEAHYLLTGDETSRTAIGRVAEVLHVFHRLLDDTTSRNMDARIQARTLQAYLLAWRLGNAPGTVRRDWPALLEDGVSRVLSTQARDGGYHFKSMCYKSMNYMIGMLNDVLIQYYTHYAPEPRVKTAVRRAVDYLGDSQMTTSRGASVFKYLSGNCRGVGGDYAAAADLNGLIVNGFGWMYQQTKDPKYRTRGDKAFASIVSAYLRGSKQFNQSYTASYRYLGYRH